jgi:ribosomal protein L32
MTREWRSKEKAAIRFADNMGRRCPSCGEYALPGRLCPTEGCDMKPDEAKR